MGAKFGPATMTFVAEDLETAGHPLAVGRGNLVLKEMRRADGTPIPLAAGRKYWEFPLEVGKTWQYTALAEFDRTGGARNGPSNRTDVNIRVEAFEDVTVPAGRFRAFRTRKDYTHTLREISQSARHDGPNNGGLRQQ